MTPRYLIVGASSFVGSRLYHVLGRRKAVATFNRRPVDGGVPFDARSMRLADVVLKQHHGLTHAFILLGITEIDACARDQAGSAEINITGTKRIIDDLLAHGIVPVFASSDAVFDGTRGMWAENDPVNPVLTYGRQKVEVERYVLARAGTGLILRLGKVVGTTGDANDMLSDWADKLAGGAEIRCARDQVMSPLAVEDAVMAFIDLAESGRSGLFHVCAPDPVSRLEFLETFARELARHRKLEPRIVSCSLRDFQFAEARPLNNSMSARKVHAALGRELDDYRTICRKAAAARFAMEAGHARARKEAGRRTHSDERVK